MTHSSTANLINGQYICDFQGIGRLLLNQSNYFQFPEKAQHTNPEVIESLKQSHRKV